MRLNKLPPKPTGKASDIPHAHKSPPAAHAAEGATKPSDYADPKNFKYPINAKTAAKKYKKVKAAISYFASNADATYTKDQQTSVARRIYNAAKEVGIDVSNDWLSRFGLASKKNKVKHAVAMQNPHYVRYQSSQPAMQRAA